MATGHEHWHERGEIYALGALDGQELKEFEAHLASGCPICEAYLRETRETLAVLHRSLRPETPPLAIKSRILDQIAPQAMTRSRQEKTPWLNWNWWGLGIGAVATAAVALVLTSNLTRTQSELEKAKAQLAAAQIESAQKDELLQLLSSQTSDWLSSKVSRQLRQPKLNYSGTPARAVEFCLSMDSLRRQPTKPTSYGESPALNRFPREFSASTIRAKPDFVCRSSAKEKTLTSSP